VVTVCTTRIKNALRHCSRCVCTCLLTFLQYTMIISLHISYQLFFKI